MPTTFSAGEKQERGRATGLAASVLDADGEWVPLRWGGSEWGKRQFPVLGVMIRPESLLWAKGEEA